MVLKTAKCLRSAWRRIKMPIYSLWQTPGHTIQSTFYSWIDLEVSIQDSKWNDSSFSNIGIKSMNKDQEYDDAWNVSMTDVLFLPMLMRSWTWVMLAGSTSSNNWPSTSDWPTHTVVGNALQQITFQPSIPQTDQHLKYTRWQNISTTILLPF